MSTRPKKSDLPLTLEQYVLSEIRELKSQVRILSKDLASLREEYDDVSYKLDLMAKFAKKVGPSNECGQWVNFARSYFAFDNDFTVEDFDTLIKTIKQRTREEESDGSC